MTQSILSSREEMMKLDEKNGLASIEQVGSQIKQVWEETRNLVFPSGYEKAQNIVIAGMGGSAYGTHVIQTLFKDVLKVPVFSIPDYELPAWVNEKTFVLLSSYSGTTEETLSAAADAKKKGAMVAGLTSGGKLKEFLSENGYPSYVFDPKFNPCGQPRFALGYSVFGQMIMLVRAGYLTVTEADFKDVLDVVAKVQLEQSADVAVDKNPAKLLAYEITGRIPIVVVAEHMEGPGHVSANALNETAKTYSEYRVIPELNHHLMEGLAFPPSNDGNLLFILVNSKLYGKSNSKRMELTGQVIEKNHGEYREFDLKAKSKLGQAYEWMLTGMYLAYYACMLNGQDPVAIPWVSWFKDQLKK